jgi:beta-glucanase (GH16 family)
VGVKASPRGAEEKTVTRTATRVVLATAAAIGAVYVLGTASAAASPSCFGHRATIVGTSRGDHLVGTAARDVIVAGRGNDRVYARQGNDLVCGGPGRDALFGGPGADKVASARGNDRIEGGDGQDFLDGGKATDLVDGGAGKDTCKGEHVLNCEPVAFDWTTAVWDDSHSGEPLDLTGYGKTFVDNFNSLSTITDGATGSGPWYAPARPDTSLAHFLSPSEKPVTFSIDTPGVLTITMQKADTSWYSGHIQTVNKSGEGGFAQRYGYFEAKMAFQKAVSWPAFWLYTPQPDEGPDHARAEIDVIEAYGDNDYDGYHMDVHSRILESDRHKSNYIGLSKIPAFAPGDMFDGQFHRYGCLVTPQWITVYLDRKELSRFPTFPEAKRPLFMRVTLAMQDGFVASATSPTRLRIDYVRAYARR